MTGTGYAETKIENLTAVRHTLLLGALTLAHDYCVEQRISDGHKRDLIAIVVIDEVLSHWNMRPFDVPAEVTAREALGRINHWLIHRLLVQNNYA